MIKWERGSDSKRRGKTKGLSNSNNDIKKKEESGIAIRYGKEQTTF